MVLMTEEPIEHIVELPFDNTKAKLTEFSFTSNLPSKSPSDLFDVSSPSPSPQHDSDADRNFISIGPVEKPSLWRKISFWKKRSPSQSTESENHPPLNHEYFEPVLFLPPETECPKFTLLAKLGETQGKWRYIHFQLSASVSTPRFKEIVCHIQLFDLEKPMNPLPLLLPNFEIKLSNAIPIKHVEHFEVAAKAAGGASGANIGIGMAVGRDREFTTTDGIKFKVSYTKRDRTKISFTWLAPSMLTLDGNCEFQVGIPIMVTKGMVASFRILGGLDKINLMRQMLSLPENAKKAPNSWHSLSLHLAQSS